jgi:hypothetical protein
VSPPRMASITFISPGPNVEARKSSGRRKMVSAAGSFGVGCRNAKIDWRLSPLGVTCKIDLVLDRRKGASPHPARELKVPAPARPRALAAQPR